MARDPVSAKDVEPSPRRAQPIDLAGESSEAKEPHPSQFEHINERVVKELQEGNPVISVDTKKKENVGDFKNGGRE